MAKKSKRKKFRAGRAIVVVILVAALVLGYILWSKGYFDGFQELGGSHSHTSSDFFGSDPASSDSVGDIVTDELSIHFLELGNGNTGDCTLIKTGNTEILIDAGSRQNSAPVLISYIDQYCTDGKLEYVIATHADQDHISGFVGNKSGQTYGGILYHYDVGTIIQFDRTNKALTTASGNSTLYGKYCEAVEYAADNGAEVYTALQCWKETDGAQRSYEIAEGITMNILYNVFYEKASNDENNYSVCMLLTQGDNNYLFTGDLEKEGEEALVENNDLPQCKLFKAGHHGSPTSSNDVLLSVIRPEIVCVCCCCGSSEYTDVVENMFPSQAFVDRVAKYTDRIYVTTVVSADGTGYESMNGNIVLTSAGGEVTVSCSAGNTVFKDTDWFRKNRTWPEAG